MSQSRRRRVWGALVVVVGGSVSFLLARRHRQQAAPEHSNATKPDQRRDRRAPGAWSADPDAPRGALEGMVRTPDGKPYDGALVAAVPGDSEDRRGKPA